MLVGLKTRENVQIVTLVYFKITIDWFKKSLTVFKFAANKNYAL